LSANEGADDGADRHFQQKPPVSTITPNVLPNVVQWRRPEHREFFLSGLRLTADEVT
jgi:hypothetical protein